MGSVWEHYGALWVVCGSIMEHYGWCVGALWVVCGSIRERNYRLKKKNYLSGPSPGQRPYFVNHTCCYAEACRHTDLYTLYK